MASCVNRKKSGVLVLISTHLFLRNVQEGTEVVHGVRSRHDHLTYSMSQRYLSHGQYTHRQCRYQVECHDADLQTRSGALHATCLPTHHCRSRLRFRGVLLRHRVGRRGGHSNSLSANSLALRLR